MKKTLIFLVLSLQGVLYAQDEVHNFGMLQIHNGGAMGFHIDLTNDGVFDENQGLTGFYNDDVLTISGAFKPVFNDIEIMVPNGLYLDVAVGIRNNGNFILGDVITNRNALDVNLDFIDNSFYSGTSNNTKINGYGQITNKQNFSFPIGYDQKLRALEFSSETISSNVKSAYFYENPNYPATFATTFNTNNHVDNLTAISSHEFWDFDSDALSTVTLDWDSDSNFTSFLDEVESLRIVGWHTSNGIWEDLGGNSISGDLSSGKISSNAFVPNNYSIITFGSGLNASNITLNNYYMSPNVDGLNDFLVIDAVAVSPNNELRIYSRWGRMVFFEKNYQNQFAGKANVNYVINQKSNLPSGIYFYIINLHDIDLEHQGFLYLNY